MATATTHAPPVPTPLLNQLQVLRAHSFVTLNLPGKRLKGTAWVSPSYNHRVDNATELVRILCALQELAQLARTDEPAWEWVLLKFWPRHYHAPSWLRLRERRGVGANPVCVRDDDTMVGLLVAYSRVGGNGRWCFNDLNDAVRRFSAQTANEQGVVPIIPIHIRVLWLDDVAADVRSIEALVHSNAAVSTPSPYRFASVSGLEECPDETLDETYIQSIGSLVRCGVRVSTFPLFRCSVTTQNAAVLVAALHAILPPISSDDTATTSIDYLQRWSDDDRRADLTDIAMLSLIADNRSVRELVVRCSSEQSDRAVRWLAFSLFSSCARHDVEMVTTTGHVEPKLVDSFRKVAFARDPVAELFHEHRRSIKSHALTRIQASRFYLYGPNQVVARCCSLKGLRVITHDPGWWSVLLPGWGRAWVHTDDAVATSTDANQSKEYTSGPRRIREFMVSRGSAKSFSWLATVGAGVETLTVIHSREVQWSALTAAFPNVTSLKLHFVKLDRLASLYSPELDDNWTKLQILELQCVSTMDDDIHTHVSNLLRALSNRRHPLAQTLQSLVIKFEYTGQPYKRVLSTALAMLSANKWLRVFALTLPMGTNVDEDTMRAAFHAHRGMLGEREKLAVLSALSRQRRSASRHFDCHVAAKILRFAGPCFFRHVDFYA